MYIIYHIIIIINPKLLSSMRARAFKSTASLNTTSLQTEVKDNSISLGIICGQQLENFDIV